MNGLTNFCRICDKSLYLPCHTNELQQTPLGLTFHLDSACLRRCVKNMLLPLEQLFDVRSENQRNRSWWRIPLRLSLIIVVAMCLGAIPSRLSASLERQSRPAGFALGMLQGALMPMALPNLVLGRDIPIYSVNNTGVNYKLGYTAGVNICGALFFGFLFWRLNRWRARSGACQGGTN